MFGTYERPINVAVGLIAITAVAFGVASWRLGFWTDEGPGPGLLPFVTACIIFPILYLVLREKVDDGERFDRNPLIAIILLCVYGVILPYVGFLIPTITFIVAWTTIFERKNILGGLLLSGFLVAFGWVLFVYLLRVPMPFLPVW
ncbi:MAG: tripartite tricarboxylate transporter TctB family protein [Xanthobacteraceae bacterium]|nr:tripartite tricarboxylate transporter TctB family protein [Xanthobacteraceae bacterium]QYK45667.1 MAG: tripartite tricarboxylate transporter TctB family protein [Xanthobacteraceae bacterium]